MPARRAPSSIRELSGVTPLPIDAARVSFDQKIRTISKRRATSRDYLVPGFIDLQINGAYGVDVMSSSAEDLLRLSVHLARDGTTSWLPTVITSPLETIERCDRVITEAIARQREIERAALRGSNQPVMAMILGMHLEGPFISPKYLGAHPPLNRLPKGETLERVLALKSLRLITLAPELAGSLDAIRLFRRRTVAVSLGHSDATYAEAIAGIEAGARMFTHLFNAMRPLHHREPGIVGAALTTTKAHAALIADGAHLHPAAIRLAACRAGSTILTSDRVAPAGMDAPRAALFGREAMSARVANNAVRLADGSLVGSALSMLEAWQFLSRRRLGDARQDPSARRFIAIDAQSSGAQGPAKVIELTDRGELAPRYRADLLLLDSKLQLKAVFIGGREVE